MNQEATHLSDPARAERELRAARVAEDAPVSFDAGDGQPRWLLDIVKRSLAKEPGQRCPSAAAMADELDTGGRVAGS